MKTILLVGNSFHTIREHLLKQEYEYVVLRDVLITKSPEKHLKRRVVCDFSSWQTIQKAVDEATRRYSIDGVMATYENYVLPAAQIAEYLGLPGNPVATAQACTDKFLMRQLFAKAPVKISPDYMVVEDEAGLRQFAEAHQFPLILKPASLAKSLLVTKSTSMDELISNYQTTMQDIERVYARYAPQRQPKLLVEEFMEGSVHSVDAFVDSQGVPHVLEQVVDYQTGYDVGYDDNFHYSRVLPSALPEATIAQVREVAKLGCEALNMKSSPAHIEIILTSDGPMIVEIGARNGGYRDRMHGLANGLDIIGNAAKLATGQQPVIEASRNDACAVLEFFPKTKGTFVELAHETELQQLASLVRYKVMVEPGQTTGKSSQGFKMSAIVVLHNADHEQFMRDLAYVNANLAIVVDTTD